jgi:formamidopyrimidine-DNA glycosylase
MPEGPEIKIIADTLNDILGEKGYIIENVSIEQTSKYSGKESAPNFSLITGRTLGEILPYGKKIIFTLMGQEFPLMVSSLGLEGHWIILEDFDDAKKYPHVSFIFSLRQEETKDVIFLIYADSRHFGLLSIAEDSEAYHFLMKDVGPSWLQETINFMDFYSTIHNKRFNADKKIVDFLVEQKYYSGIGNYMRSEILYLAKVSPHRTLNSISTVEARRIYDSIQVVINEALKSGGHTLHSYFTPVGKPGGYVPIVYGQSKTNDSVKAAVVSEKDKSNRMFHWVPSIQE